MILVVRYVEQLISHGLLEKGGLLINLQTQQLKLKYYGYMIELDQNDSNYLAICRHYMAVYNTPVVQDEDLKLKEALKCAVIFILLTGYGNERSDLFHRIKADKNLEKISQYM